jgi:hypothetical protein
MSLLNLFRRIRARGDASQPKPSPQERIDAVVNEALRDAPIVPAPLPPVSHPAPGGLTVRSHMEVITH